MRAPATTRGADPSATLPRRDGAPLPPAVPNGVNRIYDPVLARYGMHIAFGDLIDPRTARSSGDGTHFTLYSAPDGSPSPDQYASNLWDVTALLASDVFLRWPRLESFDICQQAVPPAGASEAPALTQVRVTREAAAKMDWAHGDLGALLAQANQDDSLELNANETITATSTYQDALRTATQRLGHEPARQLPSTILDRGTTPR